MQTEHIEISCDVNFPSSSTVKCNTSQPPDHLATTISLGASFSEGVYNYCTYVFT